MKTASLFSFRSVIFSLLLLGCFVIDTSAQTQDPIQNRKYRNIPPQSDTLSIDNKDIILEESPMLYFGDYRELFNSRTEVFIAITGLGNEKGYSVNFIVKDSVLYLRRVTPKGTDVVLYRKNDTTGFYMKKVSQEEIKVRVEKMTGRKFDKNGLLKADWINGPYYGGVNGKFIQIGFGKNYSTNKYFKVVFKKGVLRESTMFTDKSAKQYILGE